MNNQDGSKAFPFFYGLSQWLLLMIVFHAHAVEAQDSANSTIPAEAVTFKPVLRSYAFDPQNGVLAATSLSERHLSLFDPADFGPGVRPEPKHVDVNGQPVCVIRRQLDGRSVFVVSMSAPPSLLLMETNGTIVKRYRLQATPTQLFCSADQNDPFVYWKSPWLVKFDLRKMVVSSETAFEVSLLNISASGTADYEYAPTDENQFIQRDVNAPRPHRDEVKKVPVGGPIYIADPKTGAVATGGTVYSADLSIVIANYKFAPQQIFPDQPLIAGFRENHVCIGSTNTNTTVAEYPLPQSWFPPVKPTDRRNELNPPRVFVDSSRGRIIVAAAHGVLAVQLSDLKISTEPSLSPSAPLPDVVTFGETLEFDIPFVSPGPKVVELKEAPEGMTISGRTIRWVPTTPQVGDHQIELVATADAFTTTTKWRLGVRLPAITLPIKPIGIHVSEDESQAVIWGNLDIHRVISKIVVIDLHSGAMLEHDCHDNPISSAIIDGTSLFVLRKSAIEQLSIPQFNVVASVPLETHPGQQSDEMYLVSPKRLMVGVRRFDLPDLTEVAKCANDLNRAEDWLTGATAFGKMIDGVLWNEEFSSPRMLIWPTMLHRTPANDTQWRTSDGKVISVFSDTWYPCGPNTTGVHAQAIKKQLSAGGISCPFTFTVNQVRDSHDVEIIPKNQLTGEQEKPFPLFIKNRPSEPLKLYCGRERFQLLKGSQLISGSLSEWTSRPKPFHIEPNQTEFFLNTETPVRVKYVAEGATNYQVELRLRGDSKVVKLESKNGEFDLLIPKEHQQSIDGQAMLVFNLLQDESRCDVRLKSFSRPIESWYKEMFDRSANGKYPLPVIVLVTAEHPQQGRFTLLHSYIFEVSPDVILEAMQRIYPFAK